MKHVLSIVVVLVLATLAGCTAIHIEGNSNNVSDIEGHTGTAKIPAPASSNSPGPVEPHQ